MSERIQLRRTKGWRKPEGAIVVARPTKWGNPFTVAQAQEIWFNYQAPEPVVRAFVVDCFRDWLTKGENSDWWFLNGQDRHKWIREHLGDLADRDLACWCPLDELCHADVLLLIASTLGAA